MRIWRRFRRDELADELRAHREMLVEQFVREGMSAREAEAAARRQMGNETGAIEQSRDEWGFGWIDAIARDARFALRQMRHQPVLTATVVLIAGLGVGANTAIVSVLETAMLKPLGLRDTDRVVNASVRIDKIGFRHSQTSGVEYKDLSAMTDVFQSFAAMENHLWTFQAGGEPAQLRGGAVTPEFFRVFGEIPEIGRFFTPEDRNALVLSYRFWKSQYGGDPGVLGRSVVLDDVHTYRIVGVAREEFRFPANAEAWSSLDLSTPPDRLTRRGYNMNLWLFGRLGEHVTQAQAADRVNRYVAAFKATPEGRSTYGEHDEYGYFIDLEPFAEYVAGDLKRPLLLLWSAALAVLLTACANIAVLLLARVGGRKKEIAIRLSVGATRGQILRQLAIESLLLGAAGGLFGVAVSAAALSSLGRIAIPQKALLQTVTLDWRLMLYGMALSVASGLIFGVAPAVQLLRRSQTSAMARGARRGFQNVFIAAQIAAALVLLIATGLLLRSLWTIEGIQPGFDPSNLTTAMTTRPQSDPGFFGRLDAALRSSPGVEASALAYPIPFSGSGGLTSGFVIEGRPQPLTGELWHGEAWFVSPGFFETLRIPLLRGRAFTAADNASAPHVCMIDRKFAERFFPGEDPTGHYLGMYGRARIVGVVADIRSSTLEHESRAGVYYPMAQQSAFPNRGAIVRSRIPGGPIIRDAVRRTSGLAPVYGVKTMQELIDESLGIRRVVSTLVCVFVGICILLATIGLHGVVSQAVGEQSPEIVVRMALGARPRQILRQFMSYGLGAGAAGMAAGVGLSLYAERWLGGLLYEVAPFDAATFGEACAGVVAVLAVAVFWPARRASRMEPQSVLRHE